MAATIVKQNIDRDGLDLAYQVANGANDRFANRGVEFLSIRNGGGVVCNVTIVTPVTADADAALAVDDLAIQIPAGESRLIGHFPHAFYSDTSKEVEIQYDQVVSVTVALLDLVG